MNRGSTPLASSLRLERSAKRRLPRRNKTKAGVLVATSAGAPTLRLGRPALFVLHAFCDSTRRDSSNTIAGNAHTLRSNKPWKIQMAAAFRSEVKARRFEL